MTNTDTFTVIVSDSGVGGVGIAAEVYRVLKTRGPYSKVRIMYYNALFDAQSGYNTLKSLSQKTTIFDSALTGMLSYAPDMILLASNTLSVLYPHTVFSQSAAVPIIGLIDIGVNHILSRLRAEQYSAIILFATPVTVQDGIFRRRLCQHIDNAHIIEHACPGLEYAIGDGDRETVLRLIDRYVAEALQRVPADTECVYGSLQCTHFGYYQQEFLQALRRYGAMEPEILNPSAEMARVLLSESCPVVEHPDVSIEFVSKVRFHPDGIASLLPYIASIAEEVAAAFQHYHYDPNLF